MGTSFRCLRSERSTARLLQSVHSGPSAGMPLEILFFGAGAIGAFYASRVALSPDTNVSVICRSNYSAVANNGFKITSPQYGDYNWRPTRTFNSIQAAHESKVKWDYVAVCTKALPNISDDSRLVEPVITPNTAIVLIQNGLGVEQPYVKRFPQSTILSAVTIASCAQVSDGHVKHNRWTRINVGPYFSEPSPSPNVKDRATAQNQTFVNLLIKGGIKDAITDTHEKLQLVRWHKIAINASMNPSAVLSGGSTNEEMASDSELYTHLKGVMDEVLSIAPKVVGKPFPPSFASSEAILRSTQRNKSGSKPSMLIDWESGKPMELEVILGNPIRLAREKGFEMPRMQTIYALLRMMEKNRELKKQKGQTKL